MAKSKIINKSEQSVSNPVNPIVIVPSRMASSRLPGKPLKDINGLPMIVHVLNRALEADVGPVVVACAEKEIYQVVCDAGGRAVLTNSSHQSGSDRVYEALSIIDPDQKHDVIINLQGDLPTIEPKVIRAALQPLGNPDVEIATLVSEITNHEEKRNSSVVKVAVSFVDGEFVGRALYFSRACIPSGQGAVYHHLGLYAFRRDALSHFVSLKPAPLECREGLEQLRALEDGMRIDAVLVDTLSLGVDTSADLELVRELLKMLNK